MRQFNLDGAYACHPRIAPRGVTTVTVAGAADAVQKLRHGSSALKPEPFRFRGRWRGQVTLDNGMRPSTDHDTKGQAAEWFGTN